MTTAPSTALATIQPAFTEAERLALAGFLAGYRGLTREAYALDLHPPRTFAVRGWTTSPTRWRWTVTSSAPCWWPPGSARRPSMR